jgi:hypothetical protein
VSDTVPAATTRTRGRRTGSSRPSGRASNRWRIAKRGGKIRRGNSEPILGSGVATLARWSGSADGRWVNERLREFYRAKTQPVGRTMLEELIEHCRRPTMPPELQKLGRTLHQWSAKIINYHSPGQQRTHRSAEQPDQTHQTHRLRIPQLPQLPHPSTALYRQTQLASPRFHHRPMTHRRQNPKSRIVVGCRPRRPMAGHSPVAHLQGIDLDVLLCVIPRWTCAEPRRSF